MWYRNAVLELRQKILPQVFCDGHLSSAAGQKHAVYAVFFVLSTVLNLDNGAPQWKTSEGSQLLTLSKLGSNFCVIYFQCQYLIIQRFLPVLLQQHDSRWKNSITDGKMHSG